MHKRTTEISAMIEAVAINPTFSIIDIDKMLEDAQRFGYCRVVGPLSYVEYISNKLINTGTGFAAPIGTPIGVNETTETKIQAAGECLKKSKIRVDIDMVMNLFFLNSGMYKEAEMDIRSVRDAFPNNTLKVIVEAPILSDELLKTASKIVVDGGADYIKTSTGFANATTVEMVKKIREAVGYGIGIKAAGGIRTLDTVEALIDLGVDRIGMNYKTAHDFVESLYSM